MKCPKCNSEVPEGSNFCNNCACDLKSITADTDIRKIPHAYTPKHLADKILKTKSSIIGERKYVTVLFADVANYTAMSEKLDPEDVHQIMDGCFKILMDEIHQHKGTINQFTGDGVMALFGAPLAIEDHAQDACRASLAVQKAIKQYSQELQNRYGIRFQMRIGINSGAVVVGSIGDDLRMDYTAVGDTTNLAARMECMARPGTVLISPGTYQKVKQQFELRPLGEIKVKGKEKPVEAYELIKDRVFRPRLGVERQIYSEMVGRDAYLNKLELQVAKAIDGDGSVVNIIGEAGIGKSRLIAELRKSNVVKRIAMLEGRAISIGRNLSFHPIIDLLKNWAGISENDTEATSLGKLESAVRSVSQQDAEEITPFLATLMGMKLSGRYGERIKGIEGEALEKLILKNVKDLIIKAAEITPLVLFIEDLHWADDSSIELLESLFRLAETNRILFINVFRPHYKETGGRIVQAIKQRLPVYYVEINLEPLSQQMSEVLIDNMLDIRGLDYGIKSRIVQRSGGNPFFIEEVVRSFIDTGAVALKDGKFEVTDQIDNVVIPHTINDVLMARIDRLENETRDLVKLASVIGRNFFHKILIEVASSIKDIDDKISYLKDIQLIRERERMEELEYLFKHALAQEAAYDSILHQKRKEMHLQVARSIESVFNERLHEFYGMLALHYSKAEDNENTEHYLVKAGEEALRTSASSEALQYYKEALVLYQEQHQGRVNIEKLIMLEKSIALSLYNKARYAEAVEYFDKVLIHCGEKLPTNQIFLTLMFIFCFIEFVLSLYLPALRFRNNPKPEELDSFDISHKKLASLMQINPKRFVVESFFVGRKMARYDLKKIQNGFGIFSGFSIVSSYTGISFKLSRKVIDFCENRINSNDTNDKLLYENASLVHDYYQGSWHRFNDFDDSLVKSNLSIGNMFQASSYLLFHGRINIAKGNFDDSQKIIESLLEIENTYENGTAKMYRYQLETLLSITTKKFHNFTGQVDVRIGFAKEINKKYVISYFYMAKAIHQIMMKDIKSAEESRANAVAYYGQTKRVPHYKSFFCLCDFQIDLWLLGRSLYTNDERAIGFNANGLLLKGKKAVRASKKAAKDMAGVYRLMGDYHWLVEKQKKAFKWWEKAIKKGEALGARPDLSRTYVEVGKALMDPHCSYKEWNGMTAQDYFNKARAMFQDMDLQYDLDELDKAVAAQPEGQAAIGGDVQPASIS